MISMERELRRKLGETGVTVSRLGLGGHTFMPRYGGEGRAERRELLDMVSTALEEGIDVFDVTIDEERQTLGEIVRELDVRDRAFLACWMSKKHREVPDNS